MARFRRWRSFLSISSLLILFVAINVTTNLFLATRLPLVAPPLLWENEKKFSSENGMLHMVITRFMQSQSHLYTLGRARMALFETFCLPSMKIQLAKDYIWLIMVDPDLNLELLDRFKQLLGEYPNFYLILSNENTLTQRHYEDLAASRRILTGNLERLESVLFDDSRPLLLQTRLDADDGLHRKTLLLLQKTAKNMSNSIDGWKIICDDIHVEWRNDEITSNNTSVETSGKLRMVREGICITPGYTLVQYRESGQTKLPPWPKIPHHKVTSDWPECGVGAVPVNCWTKLKRFPAALRSRTITSAGMSRIQSKEGTDIYDNQTYMLWPHVTVDFGVQQKHAIQTSRLLKENVYSIAKENLEGQW